MRYCRVGDTEYDSKAACPTGGSSDGDCSCNLGVVPINRRVTQHKCAPGTTWRTTTARAEPLHAVPWSSLFAPGTRTSCHRINEGQMVAPGLGGPPMASH